MNYSVLQISKDKWLSDFSEKAHIDVFGARRSKDSDRIDFALLVFGDAIPGGFVTCIEMDADTLYWQMGGALSEHQGSYHVVGGYNALIEWSIQRYKLITTKIDNKNIKMLHLAQRFGFRIVGVSTIGPRTLVELAIRVGD